MISFVSFCSGYSARVMGISTRFIVASRSANLTLAACLRSHLSDHSWSAVRRLIQNGRVKIGGETCLDPARRLREEEVIEVLDRPPAKPQAADRIVIRYLDTHLVVVEKPPGISTVRHPAERDWPHRRKALHPTLEDLVPPLIARHEGKKRKGPLPRLRVVHRIDKETSGLVVFARSVAVEQGLGKQFSRHTVIRRYLAIVPGHLEAQRIKTRLVRDRGDGRRGSTTLPGVGKEAVTYVEVLEKLPGHSLVSCRLETGRTHQIRIHLAELGHPVCGEKVYNRKPGELAQPNSSGVRRLALHAAELGFSHPVTEAQMHWTMPLPADLQGFLERLRSERSPEANG